MNLTKAALQQIIDNKTKPLGALGLLEGVALQLAWLQQTTKPAITQPHIVVFAADHGIAATGLVNPFPQAVTAQMVKNFLAGGAAINVFCRQNNIALEVVDAGVMASWSEAELNQPHFSVRKKIGGTRNYATEPAMTADECNFALQQGREVVRALAAKGCNTVGFGEMGIGNTSSAALLMSGLTGRPVSDCVGRGTGADDAQLRQKKKVLEEVAQLHNIHHIEAPLELLQKVGGLEIAMMVGAYLEAAAQRMAIVVDGFIGTAALLVAEELADVLPSCFFAHTSGEQGHQKMLEHLGATPLLQLGMRLGEGTGAALAIPLLQSAAAFFNEMASFASAGVSEKVK